MILSAIWLFLCLLSWAACLTIGLPLTLLLQFSKTFRSHFFSWYFVYVVGPFLQPRAIPCRRRMFQMLSDNLNSTRDKSVPLDVLELGAGGGANLKFYPENCNLTVVDVNKFFEGYLVDNSKKFPHINYQKTVIAMAENMTDIPDKSMDVVVSTYLHCSCQDGDKVLKEVRRVLKPGGKYLFLEHVCFPQNELGLTIQRLINPLWYLFGNGCILDRDTAVKINGAGFTDVICEKLVLQGFLMFLARHEIVGIATN